MVLNLKIQNYLSRGFRLGEEDITCPSGAVYTHNILQSSCPLCTQSEEDGEEGLHVHDERTLREALEAQSLFRLLYSEEGTRLAKWAYPGD
jgi:hypothetical protein